MAQFARPDEDLVVGAWTPFPASPATLFDKIDEATPSDADYIQSEIGPANSKSECGLTSVSDPSTNIGHIMRWRVSKDQDGGAQINGVLRLKEGVNVRATLTVTDVPSAPTTYSYTLNGTEADAITDYGNLSYEREANQV